METAFYLFSEKNGVRWYRCGNCGALQRGTPPPVCPICQGKPVPKREETKE